MGQFHMCIRGVEGQPTRWDRQTGDHAQIDVSAQCLQEHMEGNCHRNQDRFPFRLNPVITSGFWHTSAASRPLAQSASDTGTAIITPPHRSAAAIDVALIAVLHAVITGGRGTGVIVADAAGAIAGGITGQAVGTGSAVSATVEGGLGAVCAVITGGRGTGVIDADAAGAIAGGITGQAVGDGGLRHGQGRSRCRFARRHHRRARHRRY